MRQFELTNEQASHLYGVLGNDQIIVYQNISETHKIMKIFDVLRPIVETYEESLVALNEEFFSGLTGKKRDEALAEASVEFRKKYKDARKKISEKKHALKCDRESFAFAKDKYEGVLQKVFQEGKEGPDRGIGGYDNIRLFSTTSLALQEAKEVQK